MTRRPEYELRPIDLPEFGEPSIQPSVPTATYAARVAAALARAEAAGLDALVVYGDREHMANVAYLTGYDPRFEETLLVLPPGRRPILFVGNEGWGYAELAAGTFDRVLCQTFSLLGQPRDRNRPFADLLGEAGLAPGMRVGSVGWKSFDALDPGSTPNWLEIPSFIAEQLRAVVGEVVNATALFMNPADGLRTVNDVDQLAAFEFAATHASQALRRVLFGVRAGMSELNAASLMRSNGLPLAAHTMFSGGERAVHGLPSPSARLLKHGDPVTMAYAPVGALCARAGFLVAEAAELPDGIADYIDRLVGPYFAAAVAWYEAIGIGVTGGELFDVVHRRLGDPFFGVGLNPGHLIHLDEWLHSPIHAAATSRSNPAWRFRSTSSRPRTPPGSPPTSRTASRSPTPTSARPSPTPTPRYGRASRPGAPS